MSDVWPPDERPNGRAPGDPAPVHNEPTIHQLRLLLVLSDELHFGRAAARLFMSQPALSRQLRSLEAHLGLTLFHRTSRRVEMTASCRALLPEAKAAVRAMDQLRLVADTREREPAGRLVVGAIGAEASMPRTRAILAELRARHPRITVEIRNLNFVDHVNQLLDGQVDVVFLRPPVPPGIQIVHLASEPRIACLPTTDSLAGRTTISIAELSGRTVVNVPPQVSRVWWDWWAVNPRPDGSRVTYGPVVADMEALLNAVADGGAMAFLPAAARTFFPRPGISYVDVADLSPCSSALAWTPASRARPTVAAVRRAAATVLRGEDGSTAKAAVEL
ncbi:LysR family transcriptional regulator [Streptomyces sp. AcH 505]|uniref:LysR substrate-binding domain-containing protein n=1 Tax=Streptomyces sp. AcH 505 TaxID=352211 RepID=UPI00099DF97E